MRPAVNYPTQDYVANHTGETIEIGSVVNATTPIKARIDVNSLTEHVFVTGSTGSGKTRSVAKIANELLKKNVDVKIVVVDWHDEYRSLINVFQYVPPKELPLELIDARDPYSTVDLLVDALDLSGPQAYVLERIIRSKTKEIDDIGKLVDAVENAIDESGWMRESRFSLLRKLYPLVRSENVDLFNGRGVKGVYENLSGRVNVIGVSSIRDGVVRKVYTALLLKKLVSSRLRSEIRDRLVIVLEEAQNLLSRDKPIGIIASMLAEIRKFNVGFIIVSQSPSKLLEDVMVNTNTKIIHSIKSSLDLEIVNRILYLPFEYEKIIPYLEVGEAVLYTRGLKKPVIVRVED